MDDLDEHRRMHPDAGDLPPELLSIAQRYAAQPSPRPTAEQTARLAARLLAEEPRMTLAQAGAPLLFLAALYVARWRARLLGPWFWAASVLLLALGAVLSVVNATPGTALALILALPLTGAMSLVYATRATVSGLREIEATCAVGFIEATVGLALAILGFDCAFGLLATLFLALIHWAPFVPLFVAWLGPLLLLAALSLPIALRWGVSAAVMVGAGPWIVLALAALIAPDGLSGALFALPRDTVSVAAHFVAAAVGACLLLLLLVYGSAWQRVLLPVAALPAA